eukprot:TRINITY_DN58290_c0_g1_i1.p1 TRINITY_DN58290_c0_g1~~TRINITY_DN58290_c0_g1_i1.p1  ORF type:complete len:233 (-),score=37.96 TRINITY_DN58290_c0_g1_i1:90-728(-)
MGSAFSECAREAHNSRVCTDAEYTTASTEMLDEIDVTPPRAKRRGYRLNESLRELFRLQDLNGNGLLEEVELVKLNEKIAMLHVGDALDRGAVRRRYSGIFRDQLDADGRPVTYGVFRTYMLDILDGLDPDEPTQVMIVQHLIAEADLALETFPASLKIRPGFLAALPEARSEDVPEPMPVLGQVPVSPLPGKVRFKSCRQHVARVAALGGA